MNHKCCALTHVELREYMRNMRAEILSGVEKEQGVRIGKLVLTKTRTKRLILGIHVPPITILLHTAVTLHISCFSTSAA